MGKLKSFLPVVALGAAGAIATTAPALAVPITYTMQFLGTGCVGSAAFTANCATNPNPTFTSVNVTLTMNNDTNNIMFDPGLGLYEINGTATVSVSGVNGGASATFADTMQVFTDSISDVGFFDGSVNAPFGLDIVDEFSNGFSGYQLGTSAPTTDTVVLGGPPPTPFSGFQLTSGDYFILTGLGATATFTGTATIPAIPEPPIGRGLSIAVAVGGILFGANRMLRGRLRKPLT
jgi:hypothetical protein